MQIEYLREQWNALGVSSSIYPAPTFVDDCLVLGAGTKLACVKSYGREENAARNAEDARLAALLCVAYGRPPAAAILRHIRRAVAKQAEGDALLASINLAMTGLWPMRQAKQAAYRSFMADGLLKAGLAPSDLVKALGYEPAPVELTKRGCKQAEMRRLKGNGEGSGEWVQSSDSTNASAKPTSPATSIPLGGTNPDASSIFEENPGSLVLDALGRIAGRLAVAVTLFDTIFIPSKSKSPILEGDVPGFPYFRYRWNQDQATSSSEPRSAISGSRWSKALFRLGVYIEMKAVALSGE